MNSPSLIFAWITFLVALILLNKLKEYSGYARIKDMPIKCGMLFATSYVISFISLLIVCYLLIIKK